MAGARLRSTIVICNVPSKNFDESKRFYSTLLGSDDFARALNDEVTSYHRPISSDGLDLTITQRFDDSERLTPYFAVNDLDEVLKELVDAGGKVVSRPADVPVAKQAQEFYQQSVPGADEGNSARVGRFAVILDPDGNHVGIIELEAPAEEHFRAGRYQRPLDEDQVEGLAKAMEMGATLE